MKIHIEKKMYLEADSNQFILKEYNGKQDSTGRDISSTVGYFAHLDQVPKYLLAEKIKETTVKDLQELVNMTSELEAYINQIFSSIELGYKDLVKTKTV